MAADKGGKKAGGKTVTVEQIRSANRRPKSQGQTLVGLGLNKIGHLVRVIDDKA